MSKRSHVKGDNGPGRNALPTFHNLGTSTPEIVLDEARRIAYETTESDLGTDTYRISKDCPVTQLVPDDYKLILLQQEEPGSDQSEEINYTVWKDGTEEIQKYLEGKFGKVYQTRLTVTPPGGEIQWHIDLNTSVICRVQIGVDIDCFSEFQFNRRGSVSKLWMLPGQVWFLNTGWRHRVLNNSTKPRVVIITEVLYDDLKPHFNDAFSLA